MCAHEWLEQLIRIIQIHTCAVVFKMDVHALRHTFGSHLSARGVLPRTAQAAMRHSNIQLTMNLYTDPRLLDVAAALEALPRLRSSGTSLEREAARGT